MKSIKIIGVALGAVVAVLIVVLALLSPKTHIERSIVIHADPTVIYDLVNDYQNFNRWSPWAAIDPSTKYEFEGPESGPGTRMKWESQNDNVGKGEQWIIETQENKYVKNGMKFGDFEGDYTSELILEPVDGGTKVTWTYNGDVSNTGAMDRAFGKFFGMFMDSMLGPFYEDGLASLKEVAENKAIEMPAPEPRMPADSTTTN